MRSTTQENIHREDSISFNMAISTFHLCFLTIFASLLIPAICHGHSLKPKKHVPLFVFGDSLFDPGNNIYLNSSHKEASAFWPYGETFFKHPTGRLSDGRLVPDFIGKTGNKVW